MTASPDVTPYVDLTLYDVDAQGLIDRAVEWITVKFPDFTPAEADTAMVVIEAMAVEVEAAVFALNRIPGAVTEAQLRLTGIDRDPGANPTATVTLSAADTAGHTIPAGTRLLFDPMDGTDALVLATDRDLAIPAGSTSGTVEVTADGAPRTDVNGTPAGTRLQVLDAVTYLDDAVLATDVTGGTDPEDGPAFLNRAAVRLQRLVATLVRPENFTASAIEETYVGRATTLDNYDPAQSPPTDRPGHVTVVVSDDAGAPLPAASKATLEAKLEGQALASLDVHLIDPTLTPVNLAATLKADADADPADVQAAATLALSKFLDPSSWPFSATVYRNDVVSVLSGVDGVARVIDVTPNTDTALPGAGPLTTPGTITITVTP